VPTDAVLDGGTGRFDVEGRPRAGRCCSPSGMYAAHSRRLDGFFGRLYLVRNAV
jgi:hypothetical protein